MGAQRVDGGEWALGNIGKAKPAEPQRKLAGDNVTPAQLDDAVAFLASGTKASAEAAEAVRTLTKVVRLGLNSGLTKRALLLLVQDLTSPPAKGGHRPSLDTIENVITALANLDQHLTGGA